ncbi:endonuclease/exonuclease/phosphatase family protein [Photobacterium sanctipauli]|uniref:Endonuclease/exonuclease/phosphatase family protein n=1 Tax=Photobacterium sanctipauli TaxID=1342794 RepID=A0A2T3NWF9_9GAMM|nr:endonuclease/exonuclease/phosphatase family protein [Photobacterium sanctipauli]PSW20637.1 endonuclease/exonuclease/phosphatase family protein [Photobacterium sanctipauli]
MKLNKTLIASSLALAVLAGCNSDDSITTYDEARFATYNLSFDRNTYADLVNEMTMSRDAQTTLIERYEQDDPTLSDDEKETAKKIIQIRNVAETIQRVRPNAFVLAEFNNDGKGDDMAALTGFQENYLAHAQNAQEPIHFSYKKNVATNTGKPSGFDLNNDGSATDTGDDAWGFGGYHGQYAFAVFSQFEIDEANVRTFQNFKWKDMPGEKNLEVVDCNHPDYPLPMPTGTDCGDNWYSDEAWEQFPLSSKNHIDLPLIVPTSTGNEVVHFLVSHPAPPIFDNPAKHNTERNRAELKFWNDYIASETYFYDDNGKQGGLASGSKFVIAGDLNADSQQGDGDRRTISELLNNSYVNMNGTVGHQTPTSLGGPECFDLDLCNEENANTLYPEFITSTSGLRLDYVIPSVNIEVKESGVFWPASHEDGYHLVYDEDLGNSKGVSSDHRMVWMDFDLSN